jgi:hypothetical protein
LKNLCFHNLISNIFVRCLMKYLISFYWYVLTYVARKMKSNWIILLYCVLFLYFLKFFLLLNNICCYCCCWRKWILSEFRVYAFQSIATSLHIKLILQSLCGDLHCENCFRYFGLWVNNMVKGSESSNMENWAISTKGIQVWWYMWIWFFKFPTVFHINL